MPTFSADYLKSIRAITPDQSPVTLVEVIHPLFLPIRRALSDCDFTHKNALYVRAGFEIVWPNDEQNQIPTAKLSFDNTSNEFSKVFDQTKGARNCEVRMFRVVPSQPDLVQGGIIKMRVLSVQLTIEKVFLSLSFDYLDGRPFMRAIYNEEFAPALFT